MAVYQCLFLILLAVLSTAGGKNDIRTTSKTAGEKQTDYLCPDPEEFYPCICTVPGNIVTDLDCSGVESEDQLAEKMSYNFINPHFRYFNIDNNTYIKTLRAGDLGHNTFQTIYIRNGDIEAVEAGALTAQVDSLAVLDFRHDSYLSSFPFEDLTAFTGLRELAFPFCHFDSFPSLMSASLEYLDLSYNPLGELPTTAFSATPLLNQLFLPGVGLQDISPGIISFVFAGNFLASMGYSFDKFIFFVNVDPLF